MSDGWEEEFTKRPQTAYLSGKILLCLFIAQRRNLGLGPGRRRLSRAEGGFDIVPDHVGKENGTRSQCGRIMVLLLSGALRRKSYRSTNFASVIAEPDLLRML
jgi:hypothetical protein